ncbi:glycerophosphodiester phosphodiesterase GDPDL7-like [Cornus florida]|uniref:glycerophosphodiester phosphodiesterase GDPDL7-like n=1 Tax=Cornus florida TaxID=4283 RepID=UPI002897BFAC|nr:glycerophosphodiester phosphodiesterase GDPDL7-like [Cornus florida]XP_059624488.1 glycerophosphodiester phosphodiesterase GDPDL7-like [Cornus florida]XP_059624489.1 glycerophosphodiester phosphodiesterase GDPDL7-like [Cornus florida]
MITRLVFVLLLIHSTIAAEKAEKRTQKLSPIAAEKAEQHPPKPSSTAEKDPHKPSKWMTLDGESPLVIARGGYSGLFAEGGELAYKFALQTSLPNVILFCDLQLTKDGKGVCQSGVRLDNSTIITHVFPNGQKSYNVSGQELRGWFALDYTAEQLLSNVTLTQNVGSRPLEFDGLSHMLPLEALGKITKQPAAVWVNVQNNKFYTDNKLDPALCVQDAMKSMPILYISSPDIGFLKHMSGKLGNNKPPQTKLVFRFLEGGAVEPTTQKPYLSILKDLSSIKSFASGIIIPKEYIWPVNKDRYLEAAPTSLVGDAHKEGLQVFVSGFANDMIGAFNYSYDPTAEYLQFIDNSHFSVDGFITDFPSTASESIACLVNNKNASKPDKGKALIITHNGASGVYSACTDLAYEQAVDDGAHIIDCSVQMSKDGVPFCMHSADLSGDTTALTSFTSKSAMVPEIQKQSGIFSFDLTWTEIKTLKPQIKLPFPQEGLLRNPANKNQGKFMTLPEFLDFSKKTAVEGILINIRNASYLASKKGLSVTDAVASALRNASFDKESTKQVLIQSDDSAVLSKFSNVPTYKRVLSIDKSISDVPTKTVEEIKKFADAVNLRRSSIITTSQFYTVSNTSIVEEMHKANVSVYVSVFRNEFVSLAFDYFADPMVELASFIMAFKVDGIITEFPATATAFMKSPCVNNHDAKLPYSILTVKPGDLIHLVRRGASAPASAPASLEVKDVVHPPLPPISNVSAASSSSSSSSSNAPAPAPQQSGGMANVANVGIGLVAIVVLSLPSMGC